MYSEWTELFADFERNLNEWLTRAGELPSQSPPPPTEPSVPRLFEERMERLQTHLDKAERIAQQAMIPLTTDIQAIHEWLDELTAARTKSTERTTKE